MRLENSILKTALFLACGFLSLAIGTLGLFLPILPTTPFVLLAASCFAASSGKVYGWLEKSKHFGPFIKNYRNKSGVPRSVKRDTLLFLWSTLVCSALLCARPLVWGILIAVGIGVTTHIILLKSADPENDTQNKE